MAQFIPPAMDGLLERYRALLAAGEDWFAAAARAHAAQCRPGCTACCHGLFDISPLDALLVSQGRESAPPETRGQLGAAAATLLGQVRRAAPEWGSPWRVGDLGGKRFDALVERLGPVPCPALSSAGRCLIYEHRPLVCRLHGLPMFEAEDGSHLGGECFLNLGVEEGRDSPWLRFPHAAFEKQELALIGELAGASAQADPEGAGTILAAVLAAPEGADKPHKTTDT